MEDREFWIFTFGCGQANAGKYVKIYGSYGDARNKMFNRYGDKWAFQYSAKEWKDAVAQGLSNETELEVLNAKED